MKKLSISVCLMLFACSTAFAAPVLRRDTPKDAEIISVRGEGMVRFVREKDWRIAVAEQALTAGDTLKTGRQAKLDLLFIDGTQIKVQNNTTLVIKDVSKPAGKKSTILGLEVGELWSRSKSVPEGLKIETPSATAAIRGTDWDIVVDKKGVSYLTVIKGSIEFYNDLGKVSVDAGEQAMAEVGKAPVKVFLVRPKDRVQWIISYPLDFPMLIYFHSHKRDEVLKRLSHAKESLQRNPSDIGLKLFLAGLLFDLRKFDDSIALFDEVLMSNPEDTMALTFKGLIVLSKGEKDNALSYFKKALKGQTGSRRTEAMIGLAGVHIYNNEISKAEQILEDMRKTDTSPLAGLALASFRAHQGEFRKAVEICSEFAARYKDDERFLILAADFHLTLDEPQKTKELIDRAVAVNPSSSQAYSILGRYYYLDGKGREAETSYKKALELDPANGDAVSELGKLLMEKGDYERSAENLTKAIEINPGQHAYWSKRGMLYNWLEDIVNAQRDFKTAVDLNPVDYQSLNGLGFIALKEGRTNEAIQYFLKASLLEPNFAEPHIFLAIAYYQLEDIEKAFYELRLAEDLDPKDPVPHIIAYIIYQDTYRPMEAVKAAAKALELLPNLKSVTPIETTQKGISNLGNALLGLGMTEWATSYAEESFNPYDAASYYFLSEKYSANPDIYVSTMAQGFLIDPVSIGYSTRYEEIIKRPGHSLKLNTTLGYEGSGFLRKHKIVQQGYFREPWELKYLIDFENYENEGYRDNGYSRGNFLTFAFGGKPGYKNGFFVWGGWKTENSGDPGTVTRPDYDDANKLSFFTFSSGYNHRFGNKNNLLLNFNCNIMNHKFRNLDPLGSTGLSNAELSFINRFGLEDSRFFFGKGIYDAGYYDGLHIFVTDSTGAMQLEGYSPMQFNLPLSLDTNSLRSQIIKNEDIGFQLKHLIAIGDRHEFMYGIEYIPKMRFSASEVYSIKETGNILGFIDELYTDPAVYYMFETEYMDTASGWKFESESKRAYVFDRWKPTDNIVIDAGLFYEILKSENTINNTAYDYNGILPKAGFAWRFFAGHTVRAAYQKSLYHGANISLAPMSVAGLVYDYAELSLNPGLKVTDYQIALESRWTGRLFTMVKAEKRDFSAPQKGEKNRTYFYSGAINAILTDRIGFFMSYKYADSHTYEGYYSGKELPFLPRHALGAGLMYVSPSYIKATLSTYYIAGQYGDYENTYKLPDFMVTNMEVKWESPKKHWMLKLAANNIFDTSYEIKPGYPAAGRSALLTAEYRF